MKEELFELRAKMVDLFREIRGTNEANEIMIYINELSASINKLNEEDLNNNINKLKRLELEKRIAEKNIEEVLKKVRDTEKKFKLANTILTSIRDAVTGITSVI